MEVITELNEEELDFENPVKMVLPIKNKSNMEETKELDLGELYE